MANDIDTGACPICGATEPPAMHAIMGHKPQIDDTEPTEIVVRKEDEGYWVKDQFGSYYEGPYTSALEARSRARLIQQDITS